MKESLIRKYAELKGTTLKDAKESIDAIIEATKEVLVSEGKVGVKGFGSMELVNVEQREARNPKTGEVVNVPKHRKIKVSLSKVFKDSIK